MILTPLLLLLIGAGVSGLVGLVPRERRPKTTLFSSLIAIAPLTAFIWLLGQIPLVLSTQPLSWQYVWMPSLGLNFGLYLDSLSILFGLLITGIGTLVVFYSGHYFKGDDGVWRFLFYLLLFMVAMLGIVMAGDLISLFIFWEGTSLVSFLLIGYRYQDPAARNGALKALLITGSGGIALLIGLMLITQVSGVFDIPGILNSGELLRSSPLYPAILALVAIGAFTKSAQTPFHIWLPDAMSAPAPASAFLHSATMVKAGIYLLARLNPVMGGTDSWFWLFTLVGFFTMLVGAYAGLKQNDLKALLAYSTISQLGVLVMLIGQDTEIAFKALVLGVLAHALYKSALFLVAGIVDHETGSRDLRVLGGLRKSMPATFAIAALAGLSMAGLPPLFGFLAKETLLATVTHPSVPLFVNWVLAAGTVFAGAFLLAQSGTLVFGTFLGKPRSNIQSHEAPAGMWLAPLIPAVLSLLISNLPEPTAMANYLADAAANAYGAKVKVSLALWTGLSIPVFLSGAAISLGLVIFVNRASIRLAQTRFAPLFAVNYVYDTSLKLVDLISRLVIRIQNGLLRRYLSIMLASLLVLLLFFGRIPISKPLFGFPALSLSGELAFLRLFSLGLAVSAALITIFLRQDFLAILALGASGLSIAVLLILEPAPDVALVQVVVDLLTITILVLTLTRLPHEQRDRAWEFNFRQNRLSLLRDALLAAGSGLVIAFISMNALFSRPRPSTITPYFAANAKTLVGATDIVSAIVVDFRAFDTLIEITVFSMIGVGIYTLLRYAMRFAKDKDIQLLAPQGQPLPTCGIGGNQPSPFIRVVARMVFPVFLMIAITQLIYGHDLPGDGFTAGVIVGLGIALWYILFGYEETRRFLHLPKSYTFIGIGLLLAIINDIMPLFFGNAIFTRLDYGKLLGLPLPKGFALTTSFIFEVSIFLAVLGGILAILNALGRPSEDDPESSAYLKTN